MNLNLLYTFCQVAKFGSFTKAAQELKQPKSRVSRAIARLEEEMETTLIRRTTRQIHLTQEGQRLFESTYPLLNKARHEMSHISKSAHMFTGKLKISAPEDLGQRVICPLINKFSEIYPRVQFELLLGNRYINLIAENIDMAFRIGNLVDSSFMRRQLGQTQVILVASPAYIKKFGAPEKVSDLKSHRLLSFHNEKKHLSIIEDSFGKDYDIGFKANHFSVLYQMAQEGSGIATLPGFYAFQALKDKTLLRVLPDWAKTPAHDIQLIYPASDVPHLKKKTFIEFVMEQSKPFFML